MLLSSDPGEEYPSILVSVSFYTDRLGKFLKTKTDVEISAQPDFEDQTLDFSDVEELMGSINTIPGACLTWTSSDMKPSLMALIATWTCARHWPTFVGYPGWREGALGLGFSLDISQPSFHSVTPLSPIVSPGDLGGVRSLREGCGASQ